MDRKLLTPAKKLQSNKTMGYCDIEEEDVSIRQRAVSEIKKFHSESNSLKKIYQQTGMAIADRIKKGKWHY